MPFGGVRKSGLTLALFGVLPLASCGSEAPRIDSVEPRVVEEGTATEVTVRGAGFHWKYDSLAHTVTGTFKVHAGDVPLDDVTWVDAGELRARLPGAVVAGRYAVRVEGPTGSATRADALFVRPAAEEHEDDAVTDAGD